MKTDKILVGSIGNNDDLEGLDEQGEVDGHDEDLEGLNSGKYNREGQRSVQSPQCHRDCCCKQRQEEAV